MSVTAPMNRPSTMVPSPEVLAPKRVRDGQTKKYQHDRDEEQITHTNLYQSGCGLGLLPQAKPSNKTRLIRIDLWAREIGSRSAIHRAPDGANRSLFGGMQ
jgi:hypothetical protein